MRYLVSGDLHLHAFLAHNFYPGFRLDQYLWVADWWADLVRAEKLDAILVAGDFFHLATPPPAVLQVAVQFIRKLPVPLVVTHGQHDLDIRQDLSDPSKVRSNSLVQLLTEFGDHCHYLHHDYFQLGEDLIYGFGWSPEPRWPELPVRPRILITHGSVIGARFGQLESWEGFDPKTLPADWAFIGDIHQFQWVGNILIPGPPIHHTFSDGEAGVVLFDSSDGSWERVPSGFVGRKRPYKFLQLLLGDEDWVDPEERIIIRKRRKKTENQWKLDLEALHWDIRNQLFEGLPEAYQNLHRELLAQIPESQIWPDMRFRILHLRVRNFRSIEDLDLSFEDHRIFLVSGPNGSGKSSLVEALRYAFFGARSGADFLRKGAKELSVDLELEYRGEHLRILRGYDGSRNYLRFWIGGNEVESHSLRSKEDRLSEFLPFLDWLQLLGFYGQFRPGLIAPLSQKERISLFSKIFGVELISQLYQGALNLRSQWRGKVESLIRQMQRATPSLEVLRELESKWPPGADLPDPKTLEGIRAQLDQLKSRWSELNKRIRLSESLEQRSKDKVQELQLELKVVGEARCPKCRQPLPPHLKEELRSATLEALQKAALQASQAHQAVKNLQNELSEVEARLRDLEKTYQDSLSLVQLKDQIQKLKGLISQWESEQATFQQELSEAQEQLALVEGYLEWVSPKSPLLKRVLEEISEKLSEPGWEVRTYRVRKSGEVEPDFSLALRVGDHWVEYDHLSGGQRIRADMYLLRKILEILGGIGLLIFDETFRVLDSRGRVEITELLSELPAQTLILISHDQEFPEYDQLLKFELDPEGKTQVSSAL